MKLKAVGPRILVKLEKSELEKKSERSGIALPDSVKEKNFVGSQVVTVVDIGPMAFQPPVGDGTPWVEIGDQIMIAKYSGEMKWSDDGEAYRAINDEDIIAKIVD